uniref:Uncharacterized protein n=1 Tax=Tetradesmus obliquus TaxID=3088 RepID=A0A383VKR7_TETOB|eukprot:jgi/Sobl393_1/5975/SZX65510.1
MCVTVCLQEALREAAAAEALAAIEAAGDGGHTIEVPATQASELEALLAAWSQQALQQQQQQQQAGAPAGSSSAGLLLRHGSSLPRSTSRSIAPLLTAQAPQCAASPSEAAAAAAACDGSSSGSLGRVSLSRLQLGLVLDERRLKELLAGGIQDANLVGGLLGCFGQLFTATLAPGWQKDAAGAAADSLSRSSSSASAAAVAANPAVATTDICSGNGADQKSDQQKSEPCGMLTVRNNDVTRVRAELESASFVSAVAPRIAVRLLHIVALAVVLKFLPGSGSSSKRLEYVNKVFGHIAEYLGRDCLDLLLCLDVAAAATEAGGLQVSVQGVSPAAAGGGSSSSGAVGSSGSPSWLVYVINDVNLLTVLDTVKLIMDYSS